MTRPLLNDKADYLIREYRAGRSTNDLAREFGVTQKVVARILKQSGIKFRGVRKTEFTTAMVASLYESGMSENAVAKKLGTTRSVVRRRLIESGVHIRNPSEAEALKWSNMTSAQRKAQVRAAHQATTGREHSLEEKIKRAKTRQARFTHSSPLEMKVARSLGKRGISVAHQVAVGPYNCDLATGSIAVEIWGGHWHWSGYHLSITEDRFRYLMDRGWNILVLAVTERFPFTPAVADNLAAEIKRLRSNPPAVCEYRVIWGAGEFTTGGRADSNEFSVKPPFTNRRNPATGQYETVPR